MLRITAHTEITFPPTLSLPTARRSIFPLASAFSPEHKSEAKSPEGILRRAFNCALGSMDAVQLERAPIELDRASVFSLSVISTQTPCVCRVRATVFRICRVAKRAFQRMAGYRSMQYCVTLPNNCSPANELRSNSPYEGGSAAHVTFCHAINPVERGRVAYCAH